MSATTAESPASGTDVDPILTLYRLLDCLLAAHQQARYKQFEIVRDFCLNRFVRSQPLPADNRCPLTEVRNAIRRGQAIQRPALLIAAAVARLVRVGYPAQAAEDVVTRAGAALVTLMENRLQPSVSLETLRAAEADRDEICMALARCGESIPASAYRILRYPVESLPPPYGDPCTPPRKPPRSSSITPTAAPSAAQGVRPAAGGRAGEPHRTEGSRPSTSVRWGESEPAAAGPVERESDGAVPAPAVVTPPAGRAERVEQTPDGPFGAFGFRFRGAEVAHLASLRHRLVVFLWDAKAGRPHKFREAGDVLAELYPDEEGAEARLKNLMRHLGVALLEAGVPLRPVQRGGKCWLEPASS